MASGAGKGSGLASYQLKGIRGRRWNPDVPPVSGDPPGRHEYRVLYDLPDPRMADGLVQWLPYSVFTPRTISLYLASAGASGIEARPLPPGWNTATEGPSTVSSFDHLWFVPEAKLSERDEADLKDQADRVALRHTLNAPMDGGTPLLYAVRGLVGLRLTDDAAGALTKALEAETMREGGAALSPQQQRLPVLRKLTEFYGRGGSRVGSSGAGKGADTLTIDIMSAVSREAAVKALESRTAPIPQLELVRLTLPYTDVEVRASWEHYDGDWDTWGSIALLAPVSPSMEKALGSAVTSLATAAQATWAALSAPGRIAANGVGSAATASAIAAAGSQGPPLSTAAAHAFLAELACITDAHLFDRTIGVHCPLGKQALSSGGSALRSTKPPFGPAVASGADDAPAKRGRGRPRKNPLPVALLPATAAAPAQHRRLVLMTLPAHGSSAEGESFDGGDEQAAPLAPYVGKKRGRPASTKRWTYKWLLTVPPVPELPERRVVRPIFPVKPLQGAGAASLGGGGEGEPPVKKRRGRPPKPRPLLAAPVPSLQDIYPGPQLGWMASREGTITSGLPTLPSLPSLPDFPSAPATATNRPPRAVKGAVSTVMSRAKVSKAAARRVADSDDESPSPVPSASRGQLPKPPRAVTNGKAAPAVAKDFFLARIMPPELQAGRAGVSKAEFTALKLQFGLTARRYGIGPASSGADGADEAPSHRVIAADYSTPPTRVGDAALAFNMRKDGFVDIVATPSETLAQTDENLVGDFELMPAGSRSLVLDILEGVLSAPGKRGEFGGRVFFLLEEPPHAASSRAAHSAVPAPLRYKGHTLQVAARPCNYVCQSNPCVCFSVHSGKDVRRPWPGADPLGAPPAAGPGAGAASANRQGEAGTWMWVPQSVVAKGGEPTLTTTGLRVAFQRAPGSFDDRR